MNVEGRRAVCSFHGMACASYDGNLIEVSRQTVEIERTYGRDVPPFRSDRFVRDSIHRAVNDIHGKTHSMCFYYIAELAVHASTPRSREHIVLTPDEAWYLKADVATATAHLTRGFFRILTEPARGKAWRARQLKAEDVFWYYFRCLYVQDDAAEWVSWRLLEKRLDATFCKGA